MAQTQLPDAARRKASQGRGWITPTWRPGAKVAWRGRIGLFLRAAEDGQVEILIGSRTYRVHQTEVRAA